MGKFILHSRFIPIELILGSDKVTHGFMNWTGQVKIGPSPTWRGRDNTTQLVMESWTAFNTDKNIKKNSK